MILILTEVMAGTGIGHLGRCTALAEILSELECATKIILNTDGDRHLNISNKIVEKGNWTEINNLENILIREQPHMCFVDSYRAPLIVYEKIFHRCARLICIDDYDRISYPAGSVILSPSIGNMTRKHNGGRREILSGADYVLLRSPFREPFLLHDIKENIESILFTVGGEDVWDFTKEATSFLCQNYPTWKKHVVIGPQFSRKEQLARVADRNTTVFSDLTALEIRNLMLDSDLAITAGGQTTYELARCGVPMVILKVAENQSSNIDGWLREGIINKYCHQKEDALTFISHEINRLAPPNERAKCRLGSPERIGNGSGYARLVA